MPATIPGAEAQALEKLASLEQEEDDYDDAADYARARAGDPSPPGRRRRRAPRPASAVRTSPRSDEDLDGAGRVPTAVARGRRWNPATSPARASRSVTFDVARPSEQGSGMDGGDGARALDRLVRAAEGDSERGGCGYAARGDRIGSASQLEKADHFDERSRKVEPGQRSSHGHRPGLRRARDSCG